MISKPESGNVLFIILIAVALFGALNFVVGNMLRGGNPQAISEQKASILADEILAQARDIDRLFKTYVFRTAVAMMILASKIQYGPQDTSIAPLQMTNVKYFTQTGAVLIT